MNKQNERYYVCELDEISSPGSYGFSLVEAGGEIEGFIVHSDDALFAYRNACPHTGANLNWMPHQFLTSDNAFIQCSIHGALFRLSDGECVHGPCLGKKLEKIPLLQLDDKIYVKLPPGQAIRP